MSYNYYSSRFVVMAMEVFDEFFFSKIGLMMNAF